LLVWLVVPPYQRLSGVSSSRPSFLEGTAYLLRLSRTDLAVCVRLGLAYVTTLSELASVVKSWRSTLRDRRSRLWACLVVVFGPGSSPKDFGILRLEVLAICPHGGISHTS